jgi:hypothetical protein
MFKRVEKTFVKRWGPVGAQGFQWAIQNDIKGMLL